MIDLLKDIVDLIVECAKLMLCLHGFLNYRFRPSRAAATLFSGSIGIVILLNIMHINYPSALLMFVCIPICALSVFGKKRFLFSAITFFGICCIDELLVAFVRSFFHISADELLENPVWFALMNSAGLFLLLFLLLPWNILRHKRSGSQYGLTEIGNSFIIFFLIGQIASLIYINACQFVGSSIKGQFLLTGSAYILAILFLALGIVLSYMISSRKRYKRLAMVNEKLLKLQNDYYQEQINKDTELRKFRHDIFNHLFCVHTLVHEQRYDEAEEYLEKLQDVVENCKVRYQTGHPLLDAIVNDIAGKYSNVDFQIHGMMSEETRITGPEICTIFSNILDNAFAAASECPDGGSVHLTLKTVGSSFFITTVNTLVTPVCSSARRLLTHKKDPVNHGIGHQNVEHCVENLEGTVKYHYDNSQFRTEIVLPFVCSA